MNDEEEFKLKSLDDQNIRYWVDTTLFEEGQTEQDLMACFDIAYWQSKDAVLGSAIGRGITWFVQTNILPAALRHYRRGGIFGKIIKDAYWFSSWEQTRPAQEFALLTDLYQANLPVPRPIAARAMRDGSFYRADILVEKIPDTQDLVAVLQSTPLSKKQYIEMGHLVRRLHDVSVFHSDLNIHNILLDKQGQFWLIDFDKCGKKRGDDWKQGNLKRLLRSFRKEKQKRNIHWQEEDWQFLMAGYQGS